MSSVAASFGGALDELAAGADDEDDAASDMTTEYARRPGTDIYSAVAFCSTHGRGGARRPSGDDDGRESEMRRGNREHPGSECAVGVYSRDAGGRYRRLLSSLCHELFLRGVPPTSLPCTVPFLDCAYVFIRWPDTCELVWLGLSGAPLTLLSLSERSARSFTENTGTLRPPGRPTVELDTSQTCID